MSELHIKDETRQPKTPLDYLRLYATGLAMGAADTVPGVSGGTVAFIMGIYGDLLHAIKSVNLDTIKLLLRFKFREALAMIPFRFLIPLGLGIATAILSLARLVSWMMDNQRVLLFSIFMGLVLGSAVAIIPKIKRWTPATIAGLVGGTLFAYILVGLVPQEGIHNPLTLFLSGIVAIMAMILPGISGSSILLVLGQYEFVLNAVKTFDIVSMASLAAGCLVGITGFARVLTWLLKRFEQPTIAVLIGFVIGSLRAVWPWKEAVVDEHVVPANIMPDVSSPEFVLAMALIIISFLLINLIDHIASNENPIFKHLWRRQPQLATAE